MRQFSQSETHRQLAYWLCDAVHETTFVIGANRWIISAFAHIALHAHILYLPPGDFQMRSPGLFSPYSILESCLSPDALCCVSLTWTGVEFANKGTARTVFSGCVSQFAYPSRTTSPHRTVTKRRRSKGDKGRNPQTPWRTASCLNQSTKGCCRSVIGLTCLK